MITYTGIKDIIEHCTEICLLRLQFLWGLTEEDMDAIYEHLLQNAKVERHVTSVVSRARKYAKDYDFIISKCDQSALTRKRKIDCFLQD